MLLTTAAALGAFTGASAAEPALSPAPSRDRKIVRRFALPGDPRGLAIGSDGTAYVGLASPQAVIAVDPSNGAVLKKIVLDSAEIASTKELVAMRTNPNRTRLYIANGSDESATILSLPDLGVLREITMEGETIRDIVPDPRGRYVYLLGRDVHVFDSEGDTELRTLPIKDAMALATTSDGELVAVVAPEDFGNATATVVALFNTDDGFAEVSREPLQTQQSIRSVTFADGNRSIVAVGDDTLFEKRVSSKPTRILQDGAATSTMMKVKVGDVVNSIHACFPENSGPQVATFASNDTLLVYAERRCSASGSFSGSNSGITPASLYGISAWALAFNPIDQTIVATDPQGFLTVYNVPRPALSR